MGGKLKTLSNFYSSLAYSNQWERLKFPGRFSLSLQGDLTIGELYCPMNLFVNTSFHFIVIVRDKFLSSF